MKNTNFKTKLIARALLLILLLASAVNFTACRNKGLEAGFDQRGHVPEFLCAYKSDKREFDIDDVILTFYYGGNKGIHLPSFELYFENEEGNEYLIKEIKNHNPEQYMVSIEYKRILFIYDGTITFTYGEILKIPKELFVNDKGYIRFCMKSNDVEDFWSSQIVYYKVKGNTVLLSEKPFDK